MTSTSSSDANRRRLRAMPFLCCALCAWLLAAAGCYSSTRPIIKIGMIAPFEGLYRQDGYAALHAVELALAERNQAGGVAGRSVALIALNDDGRPHESTLQATKLGLDADLLGVIGPLQMATAQAAGAELAAQGLAWIAPLPLAPEERPGGFSLFAPPEQVGRAALAALAPPDGDMAGPVVVFTGQPGAVLGALAQAAGSGFEVQDRPLSAARAPIGQEMAGVVWLGDAAGGAGLLREMPAAASLQRPIWLVGGPELGSPVFAGRAGDAARHALWLSSGPAMDDLPASFVAAYRSRAGFDPTPQAVLVYDAANLLLDAIAGAGQPSARRPERDAVRRALQGLGEAGWEGLAGRLIWDEQGQWREAPLHAFSVGGLTAGGG